MSLASPDPTPCTPEEARALTDQIKGATEALWSMLAEAHDRQAWRALGYGSFRDYVDAEFNISRGHAYRMLDQARVIAALAEVAQVSPSGDTGITEAAARDLKPHLTVVKELVVEATDGIEDEDERAAVARETIEDFRASLRPSPSIAPAEDVAPRLGSGRPTPTGAAVRDEPTSAGAGSNDHIPAALLSDQDRAAREAREAVDADRRDAARLHQLCVGWIELKDFRAHPRRDRVLALLTDPDRTTVLDLEERIYGSA